MIQRSEILVAVVGALSLGASVRADMRPVSPPDAGLRQPPCACAVIAGQDTTLSNPLDCLSIADLDLLPFESLPGLRGGAGWAGGMPPAQIQSDGQGSFGLCLYALLGLGVCRSVPLVKKLSFSYVPQWYHDGAPLQIGHSHAISPDCLCHATACCLVQPACAVEDPTLQYRRECVISLWRRSQCTPAIHASRGPPISGTLL